MITPPSPWFRGSHLNSSQLLISFRRVITLPCHVSIEMRGSFAPCIHYLLFFLIVSQTWNHKIIADRFTLVFILVTLSKRKAWRKATIRYFGYKNSRRIFLTCLKMTQNIRTETWRSGDCGENQIRRGLNVLVGPIVKIRTWANFPWVCRKSVVLLAWISSHYF